MQNMSEEEWTKFAASLMSNFSLKNSPEKNKDAYEGVRVFREFLWRLNPSDQKSILAATLKAKSGDSLVILLLTKDDMLPNNNEGRRKLFNSISENKSIENIFFNIEVKRYGLALTELEKKEFTQKIPQCAPGQEFNQLKLLLGKSVFPTPSKTSEIHGQIHYNLDSGICFRGPISENKKIVFQQPFPSKGYETCIAMLLNDLKLRPDLNQLVSEASNANSLIKNHPVNENKVELEKNNSSFLTDLQNLVTKKGSCIISTKDGDNIVCDAILTDSKEIRISDPWHGR